MSTTTPSSLLDPHVLQKINKMEMVATQVMDGYVQGMHRSPHIGLALDFAQHRQYVPGDDVKRIDWRAFAKSERYYIKQYEVTTNLRCNIILDGSASMAYRGAGDPMSKLRYAQFVSICLTHIVLHQQDSVGLITFDNKLREFLPPRSSPAQFQRVAATLDEMKPERESAIAPLLHEVAERIARRSMVVVISDLFDNADALVDALHHLHYKRHEVILMQTMAKDELEFPFRKWSLFENLENTNDRLKLDPAMMRSVYLQNVAKHLARLREVCNQLRMTHVLLNTSEPFDDSLMTFLAQRNGKK